MGAILMIAGGFCGLLTAIVAVALFGASPLVALALWSLTGISVFALGFLWSSLPDHQNAPLGA